MTRSSASPLTRHTYFFDLLESTANRYGDFRVPDAIDLVQQKLDRTLHHAARYLHHFRLPTEHIIPAQEVEVKFMELTIDEDNYDDYLRPLRIPQQQNLLVDNAVNIILGSNQIYGMEITNHWNLPVYVWVFFFDSDFSVLSYYQPAVAKHSDDDLAPIQPMESLTIGYGDSEASPFAYQLQDGLDLDVGFVKVFLSLTPANLSHVVQDSPFDDDLTTLTEETILKAYPVAMDAIIFPVVQHRRSR